MTDAKDPAVMAQFAYAVAEAAWDYIDTVAIICVQERRGEFRENTRGLRTLQKEWARWCQRRFLPDDCAKFKADSEELLDCPQVAAWSDKLFNSVAWDFTRMKGYDDRELVGAAFQAACMATAAITYARLFEMEAGGDLPAGKEMFPAWFYRLPQVIRPYTMGCGLPDIHEQASQLFVAITQYYDE